MCWPSVVSKVLRLYLTTNLPTERGRPASEELVSLSIRNIEQENWPQFPLKVFFLMSLLRCLSFVHVNLDEALYLNCMSSFACEKIISKLRVLFYP